MKRFYIPDVFAITTTEYGIWQEWEDTKVYFFRAVAASVSILVFESQSHILNMFCKVLDQLACGLSFSAAEPSEQDRRDQNETSEQI